MVNSRKAIESLYNGTCEVYEYQSAVDEDTKITRQEEVLVYGGVACRLSYKKITSAVTSDMASGVSQQIELFVAPELDIKAGGKVVVTQNGRTVEYKASGQSAVYSSHQQIVLELFKEWC